jgi:hypothetical protein
MRKILDVRHMSLVELHADFLSATFRKSSPNSPYAVSICWLFVIDWTGLTWCCFKFLLEI